MDEGDHPFLDRPLVFDVAIVLGLPDSKYEVKDDTGLEL